MCSYGVYQGLVNVTQVPFHDKRRLLRYRKIFVCKEKRGIEYKCIYLIFK